MNQTADFEYGIEIFKTGMHLNGGFSLFTVLIGIYMILYKSTKQMGSYRWYLLNITLWAFWMDIYLSVFYLPYLVFPAIGVCSEGPFRNLKHPVILNLTFQMFIFLLGGTAWAIMFAFLYRLAAITEQIGRMHRYSSIIIMVLFHIFNTLPSCISVFFAANYYYDDVIENTKNEFPLIYDFSLKHACIFISVKAAPVSVLVFAVIAFSQILLAITLYVVIVIVILYQINKHRRFMSSRTYAMHLRLTISLAVQCIVPSLFLCGPFFVLVTLLLFDKMDTPLAKIAGPTFFAMASMHGSLNTIFMLSLTKPYKRAFFNGISALFSMDGQTIVSFHKQNPNITFGKTMVDTTRNNLTFTSESSQHRRESMVLKR